MSNVVICTYNDTRTGVSKDRPHLVQDLKDTEVKTTMFSSRNLQCQVRSPLKDGEIKRNPLGERQILEAARACRGIQVREDKGEEGVNRSKTLRDAKLKQNNTEKIYRLGF